MTHSASSFPVPSVMTNGSRESKSRVLSLLAIAVCVSRSSAKFTVSSYSNPSRVISFVPTFFTFLSSVMTVSTLFRTVVMTCTGAWMIASMNF